MEAADPSEPSESYRSSPQESVHTHITLRIAELPEKATADCQGQGSLASAPSGPLHSDVRVSGVKCGTSSQSILFTCTNYCAGASLPRFRCHFWQKRYTFLPQSPFDLCQFFSRFRPNPPLVTLRQALCVQQSSTGFLQIIPILHQGSDSQAPLQPLQSERSAN